MWYRISRLTLTASALLAHLTGRAEETLTLSLPDGSEVTGTTEMADSRGVLLKREDSHTVFVPVSDLGEADRGRLDGWLSGKSVPPGFVKPDHSVMIKTNTGTLAYDTDLVEVTPGASVAVTLENNDDLQHNIVFLSVPGEESGARLALDAINLGGEGMARNWIPESDSILAASNMVNPHESARIFFRAPDRDESYPYVCTFPGHAQVMKGMMAVGNVPEEDWAPQSVPPGRMGNVHYKLFHGNWNKLPDFNALEPVKSGPVKKRRFNVKAFKKKNQFGVVFSGQLNVPQSAEYGFRLASDDGSRLWIDGKKILDADGIHGISGPKPQNVTLTAGLHEIVVEYFERDGHEELEVEWSGPGVKDKRLSSGKRRRGGENQVGIPLYPPKGEAMVYRNFIDGVGTARGIGVGFSEGLHFAFDAQNGRVAMIWRGGFIDAKRHWTGRGQGYQPPGGKAYPVDPPGQMLAVLPETTAPWPADGFVDNGKSRLYSGPDRQPGAYRFGGYEFDNKYRPVFLWEWNGIRVADFTRPVDGKMKRTLRLTGQAPKEGKLILRLGGTREKGVRVRIDGGVETANGEVRVPVDLSGGAATIEAGYDLP